MNFVWILTPIIQEVIRLRFLGNKPTKYLHLQKPNPGQNAFEVAVDAFFNKKNISATIRALNEAITFNFPPAMIFLSDLLRTGACGFKNEQEATRLLQRAAFTQEKDQTTHHAHRLKNSAQHKLRMAKKKMNPDNPEDLKEAQAILAEATTELATASMLSNKLIVLEQKELEANFSQLSLNP